MKTHARMILALMLITIANTVNGGETSAYFNSLKEEFKKVGEARFVAGENEDKVIGNIQTGGGMEKYFVDGQRSLLKGIDNVQGKPFSKACTFEVKEKPGTYWNASFRITNEVAVHEGEAMLIIFWAKGEKAPQIVDDGQQAALQAYIHSSVGKFHKGRVNNFYDCKEVGKKWKRYYIKTSPATMDFAPGKLSFIGMIGHKKQTIEVGGVAWMAFPKDADLSQMPKREWNYEGRAPDAPWRKEAEKRIDQYRKGNLAIKVVDEKGNPLPSAKVQVRMQKHAFPFGVAIRVSAFTGKNKDMTPEDTEKYRDISSRYFNKIVLENALKWWAIENGRPSRWQNAKDCMKYYYEKGMKVRGHVLVWPTIYRVPEPVKSKIQGNKDLLGPRVIEHIQEMVTEFKPWISDWDVTNETNVNRDFMDTLGPEAMVEWYRTAHESDPKTTLTFNEPHFGSEGMEIGSFPQKMLSPDCRGWVGYLINQKAPLDYLGSQCHGGAVGMDFGEKSGPEGLWAYYDELYSRYGKKLQYTELDVTAGNMNDPEQLSYQADRLRDSIIIAFAHPAFTSITQWGFWEGAHYSKNAALWSRDWTIRPNGQAYVDLVSKRWWTNADLTSDKNGSCDTRAFYGTYAINVEVDGKTVAESTCSFDSGDKMETIVIHP
ncbi:MAG: endo-1,4-beta-xylanase [Planctomycetes bacterium]|nr:endo-1,4-beta-xylanase [Planctomycetota bacterium]